MKLKAENDHRRVYLPLIWVISSPTSARQLLAFHIPVKQTATNAAYPASSTRMHISPASAFDGAPTHAYVNRRAMFFFAFCHSWLVRKRTNPQTHTNTGSAEEVTHKHENHSCVSRWLFIYKMRPFYWLCQCIASTPLNLKCAFYNSQAHWVMTGSRVGLLLC